MNVWLRGKDTVILVRTRRLSHIYRPFGINCYAVVGGLHGGITDEVRARDEENKWGCSPSQNRKEATTPCGLDSKYFTTLGFANSQKGQNWGLLAQSSAGGVSHICNMSLGGLRLHSEVIEVEQHGGGTKRDSSSELSAWRLHVLSMPAWLISADARASAHAPMWTACATTDGQPWLGGSGTYHKMEESTQQRKASIINITTTLSLGLDISECF